MPRLRRFELRFTVLFKANHVNLLVFDQVKTLTSRDGLTDGTPAAMSRAYVYALLAFLASSSKAVSDLLHLWHGRRATVRIKSQLTAAIYDKALRRKDASGVVAEKETEDKDGKDKEKEEKKSNADTGKIVNLMAGE